MTQDGGGRKIPVVVLAVLGVVGGLAIGRFVTADEGDAVQSTAPAPASSPADQVQALEAAVASDPEDARSWQSLGLAYVRSAIEVGDPSFYALADKALTRADELVPGDPTTLVGRGTLALSRHQFDTALEIGARAREAQPGSASVLGVVVDAQVELGRYDEASATLQQMLDIRPSLPALSRASYQRELRGDLDGAVEAMGAAIAAGSGAPFDTATVTSLRGDLQFRLGDLDGADESYERALEAAPGLVAAEVGSARVDAARGSLDEAIAALEDVTGRSPNQVAVLALNELRSVAGDDQALAESDELVRAMASLQEGAGQVVDLEMALFEADRGANPQRAVTLARRAYEARPDNVYVNDALGWALFRSGDAAGAVPFVEASLRLGTADGVVRYHAAEVFTATGDLDRARTELGIAFRDSEWFSFRHHDAAVALAERLDVTVASPPA